MHIMGAMGNDMLTVFFEEYSLMLDRNMHEYHLSPILGFQLPCLSLSILHVPFGKVGFYLRHLFCGLRLPPYSFFLVVLCFYKVHLVQLCPNAVLRC